MKRIAYAAAAAGAVALIAGAAQAQVTDGFELGLELQRYDYSEAFVTEEGPGSIEDQGTMAGFSLAYGRRLGDWSVDARFRYAQGEIDYRSSDGDRLDDVAQARGQLELLVGRPIARPGGWTVTPFAGLGSRVLLDDSGGRITDTGLAGYDREVTYAYVPLGAAARYDSPAGWTLSLQGQFNWVVGGESRADFSSLGGPEVDLEFDGGHGFEFAAAVSRPLGGGRIGFGPYVRLWDIDESAPFVIEEEGETFELVEPENETTELGVRLSYTF